MGNDPASQVSPARRAAVKLLAEQRRRSAWARDLLRSQAFVNELSPVDRALATRLVLGVVATSGTLDAVLNARTRKLEPRVRDALRVAAFELLYLGTPVPVAVSQGVGLTALAAPRARGLANAVLRRVAEQDAPRVRAARERSLAGAGSAADLALASGLPAWLVERVAAGRSVDEARSLALSHLDPAPVWVAEKVAARGRSRGELAALGATPEALPHAWRVGDAGALARSGLLAGVALVAADYAAQQVSRVAAPAPGSEVLEVGQGRGTKTVLLQNASLDAGGLARITAIDKLASKVRVSSARLSRDFGDSVRCLRHDATALDRPGLPPELNRGFNQVFVDAPCSGTGTMRRHPEIAWALSAGALDAARPDSLPALQLAILTASAARVAPGGALTYATCSVLPEEDERVVEAFLASEAGRDYRLVGAAEAPGVRALPRSARAELESHVDARGFFRTTPALGGSDGHFCAYMVRKRA